MSKLLTRLGHAYQAEIRVLQYVQPVFLLIVRAYWGREFFLAGRGKLMNIERTADFFASIHIPMPLLNAYAAGLTECLGGLLLLFGILSRLSTIPLIGTMLVAYLTAHTAELHGLFSNPDGFVSAPPFLFLLAATIVLLFGPGAFSVDGLVRHFGLSKLTGIVPSAAADKQQVLV